MPSFFHVARACSAGFVLVVAVTAVYACSSSPTTVDDASVPPDATASSARDTSRPPAPPPLPPIEARGVPCEVALFVQKRCLECHDGSLDLPRLGTRDDFAAPYPDATGKPLAEVALGKITADRSFMPPPPRERTTKEEVEALRTWIGAGLPSKSCDPSAADASTPRDGARD